MKPYLKFGSEIVLYPVHGGDGIGLRGILEDCDETGTEITTLAGAANELVRIRFPWSSVRYVRTLLAEERVAPIDYSGKAPDPHAIRCEKCKAPIGEHLIDTVGCEPSLRCPTGAGLA